MISAAFLLLAGSALAYPPLLSSRQSGFPGIATFNNFAAQGSTVCGKTAGQGGTYGAAASDISPNISGGKCYGGAGGGSCNGQGPGPGFQPPQCPQTNCGKCFKVTNQGGIGGGTVGGIGNTIIVQIIDSCPSESAQNSCKTDVPANQRCGDPNTNQLDIDQAAYAALTGQAFGSGPTLNINIEPSGCDGSGSTGVAAGLPSQSQPVQGSQSSAPPSGVTNPDPNNPSPTIPGNGAASSSPPGDGLFPAGGTQSSVPGQSGLPYQSFATNQGTKCKRGDKKKKKKKRASVAKDIHKQAPPKRFA